MTRAAWEITSGSGPIIATAIHAGHDFRPEVAERHVLDEAARLREEDPFTDRWIDIGDTQIVVHRSRFEVDLNRPRDAAVYRTPSDAWELDLWSAEPGPDLVSGSLDLYDGFYDQLRGVCDAAVAENGRFVLLDLHSYNHRRGGPDAPVDDPAGNPEINVGTGTVDRTVWAEVVDAFAAAMAAHPFDGGTLDVRENVRFRGGHLSGWINATYPGAGCALAIEMKKIFMDEWTGEPNESMIAGLDDALRSATQTIRGVLDA
jgi:N-formylglutamate amidohydrolase